MKMQSTLLLAAFASLSLVVAFAADDAITTERFPDADTVVVSDVTKVAYNPDGTYVETCENRTKILTEKGRRDARTIRLDYSKRYGAASVDSVIVVGTNGVSRTIDVAANSKETTDNGSMAANIYDPLDRQILCSVPGLEVGETLCVKTTRRALKPRCQDQWSDIELFESTCPVLNARVEIVAPKERPLKKIAIRHPLGNVTESRETRANGDVLHVFTATNSPQAFPEPDMPPFYTQVQNLRVSTAENWPEISRWYWDLCAPHLAKTNAAMVAKVEELKSFAADAPSSAKDQTLLRRIFKFVSQEIRYMGLTMEDTSPGYAPHDVDVTFDNRYGVCRDKAGLLVAMLRIAGFKAFPTLINVGAKLDPEVPQPFFNHAIVAVDQGEKNYVLMDPTNENTKDLLPAYENDKSYLVCRPEGDDLRIVPVQPPDENALRVATRGTLAKDGGLAIECDIRFSGINDTAYRASFVRRTPEERVKFFENAFRRLAPGAEIIRCEIEPRDMRDTETPVHATVAARLPEMLLKGETRDTLTVPFVTKTLGMANFLLGGNTSLEKRRFNLVLDSTASLDETVEIDLGDNVGEVLELPTEESPTARRSAERTLAYDRSFSVSNGVLKAHRKLAVTKVELTPEEYAGLREDVKRVEAAERKNPVFRVDPLAEADVRWIDESTEVDVASDTAWTVTNRVVKEVLTYKGKKRSAELELSYNPCVEKLEIVSAVVSNRDGRVSSVTPREINEMDCGWAGRAPRYPASKILVVNLPSVEIGSVISYVTARTVTNAPAAYYGVFGFDSTEPLERRFVRVNDWTREVLNPRRIPREPGQPVASLWRDRVYVSSNRFAKIDLDVRPFSSPLVPADSIRSVRDWMAKNVRLAGPGLYEVPLAQQLTDPETVLRERYATRLDYVRTMAALLQGAGFDADVVLATDDATDPVALRERDKSDYPNVRAFSAALCRVRVREGGFLGFGGETTTWFVGTENQYAPLGPSAYANATFFDPATAEFGVVTVPSDDFLDASGETTLYRVRENGGVDLDVTSTIYGTSVGSFRKTYSEILPEDRSRLHQTILGAVAQAATATSDLAADTTGYPATRTFSCFIPDFATVEGDAISLTIPALVSQLPTFTGRDRQTPFAVGAADREFEDVTIRFPEGYTVAEHLPESFSFSDPADPKTPWLVCRVTSRVVDNALEVKIRRDVTPRVYSWFGADAIELVRERSRRAASRASRTIVVRKAEGK